MKCKNAKLLASLQFDGRLDERRRAELEAHLEECRECREEAEIFDRLSTGLESIKPVEPAPGGWERIMARIEEPQRASFRQFAPAFSIVIALIVIAAGLFFALEGRLGHQLAASNNPSNTRLAVVKNGNNMPEPKLTQGNNQNTLAAIGQYNKNDSGHKINRPVIKQETVKHHKDRWIYRHSTPRPAPRPEKPSVSPKPDRNEEQPAEEEYYAAADQVYTDVGEISDEADALIARGMSVLVEASSEQDIMDGGSNL